MEISEDNEIFSRWKPISGNHKQHPSIMYESERLASVDLPKKEIELHINTYNVNSPNDFISDVQVEAISYAVQCFENKNNIDSGTRGFILGDGTGSGKSRTISGILAECYIRNPTNFRAIWVSLNQKLERTMKEEYSINHALGNVCPRWLSFDDMDMDGVLYVTYSNFLNDDKFLSILKFLNTDNTLLIFDESHYLKNKNSQTAKKMMQLQNEFENPRVIYSTATSASNVRQMYYMTRLGLFEDHKHFVRELEYYGNAAMEMSAIQLKYSGHMISRQLGLHDIKIDVVVCKISSEEQSLYDHLSHLFFQKRYEISTIDKSNFYQYLILSIKMKHLVTHVKKHLAENKSIVIGLNSTCDGHKSPLHDLLAKYGIESGVEHMINPLDNLINEFGVENVAEISGRHNRLIFNAARNVYEVRRVPSTAKEIDAFQRDRKQIAIITRAGNAGISLHSSQIESRQRYHIIFEIPKSADLVVQQIGRTHRTTMNTHKPRYSFFISNIPAEMRFVFGITTKLEKLGALTKGDKRASVLNNVEFNGCSSISKKAYDSFILDINLNIAKNWFDNHHFEVSEVELSQIRNGLAVFTRNIRTNFNKYVFFSKILSNLNEYIIDNEQRLIMNDLQYISLKHHARYWVWIFKGMQKNVHYNLDNKILYCLLIVIFEQIKIYIPNTKFENFSKFERWTKKNHVHSSPYVKSVVKTLLLCKSRPECHNTLGRLPSDVFYNIIPFITHNNNILSKISVEGTDSFKEIYKPQKMNAQNILLNNFFDMKIDMQKALFHQLRYHVANTEMQQKTSNKNVINLNEYVLKSNVNEYEIVYDSFEKKNDEYELSLSLKRKISFEDFNEIFSTYLKPRMISYVRNNSYQNKFGILISVENKIHKYEIWYPGKTTPAQVFMNYNVDNIRKNYIYLSSVTDNDWHDEVERILSSSLIVKYKYKLQLSIENAIQKWAKSTGVLLKIQNTNICRDFVGLLLKIRKF